MYKKFYFFLISCISLININLYSQLTNEDIKKIEKANEQIKLADALVDEATQLYLETFKIKSDVSLSEKEIDKRCKKLEEEANKKQLKANELYYKAYDTKISIYKLYIIKFLETQGKTEEEYLRLKLEEINEYLIKANEYETKAAKIKDEKERILLLNNGREQRLKAFEIAEQTFNFCYITSKNFNLNLKEKTSTIDYKQKEVINDVKVIEKPQQVRINEFLLQNFQKYVSDTISSIEFLTPEKIAELLTYTPDQLKNFWYRYYFLTPSSANNNVMNESIIKVDSENNVYQLSTTEQINKDRIVISDRESSITKDNNIHEKKKKYRIQIYAGKNSLDQNALKKIYDGNKNLEYIYENGLYKYSLGDFSSYREAEKFKKEAGLTNSVIVEYTEDTDFKNITDKQQFAVNDKVQQTDLINVNYDDGIIFRVQIAASRFRINMQHLNQFYKSSYTIEEIFEENWFKYQTIGTASFNKALNILENISVKGIFISAYQNNKKIELQYAIKQTKNVKEPYYEFHVQILASRSYLSINELKKFYRGAYPVSIFFEDNLYKYRIKAGSSYDRALEIKNTCNVSDAFIVAYEDGIKIPLYKYLKTKIK